MAGKQLDDATAAAREFLAAKSGSDRVAVVVFGSKAVQLTRFASSTIDADDALRTMAVDAKSGTALNDAVALSASLLAKEHGRARVVVLLTDGQDVSSKTTLDQAIAGAHEAGTLVYPISIGASDKTEQPLQQLAKETGGAFNSAASSKALSGVYSSVASGAEAHLADRVRHGRAARREAPPARVASARGCGLVRPHDPGQLRGAERRRRKPSVTALHASRRAAADAARRLPRADRLRVPAHLGQGLVGEDPPGPARRGHAQVEAEEEGRAHGGLRGPLPRDRAGLRAPARLDEAPAPARAGGRAAAHGRVRLHHARLRLRLRLPRGADGPLLGRDPDRARASAPRCRTCGSRSRPSGG